MNKLLVALALVLPGTPVLAQVQLPQLPPRSSQAPAPVTAPSLPPGLYVQVLDGMIHVTNPAGTQNFAAGQFGYTPNLAQPPVIVPRNPGILFAPPPVFNPGPSGGPTASTGGSSGAVDCIVR